MTVSKVYRLVRTVARPSTVVIVYPPQGVRANEIGEQSPDGTMARAPIGPSLSDQRLVTLSKAVWICRSSTAPRHCAI